MNEDFCSTPLVHLPDTPLSSMTREEFATYAKTLSPELLAQSINHCHEQAERNALLAEEPLRRCLEWAFGAGLFLIWAKKTVVKHGDLEQWVRDNCRFNERQAQRYMRLVKKWPEIQAKATSEDAFPKSVNGLLGLVAKEKRRSEAEPDAQVNVQNEVEDSGDEGQVDEPKKPEGKSRPPATNRSYKTQDGEEGELHEEVAEPDADEATPEEDHDEEHDEADADEGRADDPNQSVVFTAQVAGFRSFFLDPKSGYDVSRVIFLLHIGEAKIRHESVYLGDEEIAWLDFKVDQFEYSDIRVATTDPLLEQIAPPQTDPSCDRPCSSALCLSDQGTESIAIEESPSEPQTKPISLPPDPYFPD